MALVKYIIPLLLAALSFASCSNEKSLQKYLVEKQDNDKFLKVDVATSLLQSETSSLSEEEKEILKTVKKVNVVAYKITDDVAEYETEKGELAAIMKQEKYKTLIKFGSNSKGATLKYLGEEDAIDEVIVFASDDEKGFAVFRLLGKDMRPDKMIKLMKAIDKGDIDVSKFSTIGKIFDM
ncbi:DUF4252 domain-containing protein [Ulvibacter litoralis]|uniref:DUF4252 domain-containing protein n=1 Tax=Ulvibacter litoralis TaxID=227084 RepID=A0A1G7F4B5_9FLAO|nr:DUF4252 domain-containing protein [Ulvibacter litoralis]GHC52727.1 hypothetical protein GCM10008083_15800 [Ulvibacter litoralis]SDE70727.1 protein of unknown function [Ulvibacter litoralis]